MKKFLIILLLALSGACAICACNCNPLPDGTYIVKYIIEGNELYSAYAQSDEIIGMPVIEPREGLKFKGWYLSEDYIEKWDFENDTVRNNTNLYAYWTSFDEETFNIVYYDAGSFISYEKLNKGELPSEYYPDDKFGYEFKGWKSTNKFFDFSLPVLDDISLTAVWEPIQYSVKLLADGIVVSQINYTVEDAAPEFPEVPEKQFYSGKWEPFRKFETAELNAIYEPITYTATFIDDGKIIQTTSYTVEDTVLFPELQPKNGYTKEWENISVSGGDVTVNSIITPIVYTATFVADGIIIDVKQFTLESKKLSPPPVPARDGYVGSWENNFLTASDVIINAVYKIKVYYASFVADGKIVLIQTFQVDDMSVNEPEIPQKDGFTSKWQDYELTFSNVKIEAEYIPITYHANFYADDKLIESIPFTVVDNVIKAPQVPDKPGYSGAWEDYILSVGDLDIYALYLPILYRIKFICDNRTVGEAVYTVEFKNINVPKPLEKDGYTVKWEAFTLTYGDITVNAVYTPIVIVKDEFNYEENPNGSLSITGYYGEETEIIIPSVHNGKQVTAISDGAFMNGLFTSVVLSEGIENIGNEAFQNCTQLLNISLPESLKSIGGCAFALCGFENIILPNNVSTIGENAFAYSKLQSVRVPNGVSIIDKQFYSCTALTEITLHSGITQIEAQAFTGCLLIQNVIFDDPDGWTVCADNGIQIKAFEPEELSDSVTASNYLINVYYSRHWIKING